MKKNIFLTITLVLALFGLIFAPSAVFAKEVIIVYTGNTYAALYPCGVCPASVGGGLSRRVTAIKKLRAKNPDLILIDSGNFTAGGVFDQEKVSKEFNRLRSQINYRVMDLIGYDFVGLGEDEFNFGQDFLENKINEFTFKVISSNINFKGVLPYVLKTVNGVKVGIIGLSSQEIAQKSKVAVKNFEVSLSELLPQLEEESDIVVLLSSAGSKKNQEIAQKFPQINIIIASGDLDSSSYYEVVGKTKIFRPSFSGKSLGVINLEYKGNQIIDWKFAQEKLSLDVKEDPQVNKILPVCFSDQNCPEKKGLIAKCQKPGDILSNCAYYAVEKIDSYVITDKDCSFCSIEAPKTLLEEYFLGLNYIELHYKSKKAKDLIDEYEVSTLPYFIFEKTIKNEKAYSNFAGALEEKKDHVVAKKNLSGVFLFLERKKTPNHIDLFIDFNENNTLSVFNSLAGIAKKNDITINFYYIAKKQEGAAYPQEEVNVALAVQRVYPDRLIEYIRRRIEEITRSSWIRTLDALGMEYEKIKDFMDSDEINKAIADNNKLIRQISVSDGNVILINNRRIFKVFNINEGEILKFFD